jgi:hypothetical protein
VFLPPAPPRIATYAPASFSQLIAEELCHVDYPCKARTVHGDEDMSDSDEEEPAVSSTFVARAWASAHDDVTFLPSEKCYGLLSTVSHKDQIQARRQEFSLSREALLKETKQAGKLEKTLTVKTVLPHFELHPTHTNHTLRAPSDRSHSCLAYPDLSLPVVRRPATDPWLPTRPLCWRGRMTC